MKDDHQADHLEVAMQTPDGTFYKVIPSAFLWTVHEGSYGRFTSVLSVYFYLAKVARGAACTRGRNRLFTELMPCWLRSITRWETIPCSTSRESGWLSGY